MKIEARVNLGSKRAVVEEQADGTLVVKVKEAAREGRANKAVVEAIAGHFGVPKTCVAILHGRSNRTKLIEVIK